MNHCDLSLSEAPCRAVSETWEQRHEFVRRQFLSLAGALSYLGPCRGLGVGHRPCKCANRLSEPALSMWSCRIRQVESPTSRRASSPTSCPRFGTSRSWSKRSRRAQGNLAWDEVSRAKPDGYTWTYLGPAPWPTRACTRTFAGPRRASCRSASPSGRRMPSLFIRAFRSIRWRSSSTMSGNIRAFSAWSPASAAAYLGRRHLFNATKLDMVAVPYNGAPPAVLDLMANRVQFAVRPLGLVAPHIDSGALKALAVVATARSPLLPNVPTMNEAGYPETNVVAWARLRRPTRHTAAGHRQDRRRFQRSDEASKRQRSAAESKPCSRLSR